MKKRRGGRRAESSGKGLLTVLCVVLVLALGTLAYMILRDTGREEPADTQASEEDSQAGSAQETQEEEKEEPSPEELLAQKVQETLDGMTLEQKVNQLFMLTPEQLTGVETAVQAGDATRSAYEAHPVGGLIYFAKNLQNPDQTRQMLSNTSQYARQISGLPVFLSVDEEGGQVSRIASNSVFQVPVFEYLNQVGQRGDTQEAHDIGSQIGAYLKDLGFNMDAAPDTDVLTNPANEVVKYRSFGSDPQLVASMAQAELQGLNEQGIIGMYKHFPGHGGTTADSHEGYVYVEENLDQLKSGALVRSRAESTTGYA